MGYPINIDADMNVKLLILWLLPVIVFAERVPMVTLTETNGTVLSGKITTYSTQSGKVTLNTTNGSIQRPVSAFITESQNTILLWRMDKEFMKDSKVVASFVPNYNQISSNVLGTVTSSGIVESNRMIGTVIKSFYGCTITITNTSEFTFNELQAEYRIFFTQNLIGEFSGKYQLCGLTNVSALTTNSTWQFTTTPILHHVTYKSAPTINWIGMPAQTTTDVMGILLRLRKKGASGEWIERQIEYGTVPSERDRASFQKLYKTHVEDIL